ncbi:hypothetical protein [Streptomyces sp. NPDC001404]|uniref:hypothetical protein n=1 Tax=Streptomyces sp. NPDC001404 TaxID=3364571 RepID=UPI0036C4E1C7
MFDNLDPGTRYVMYGVMECYDTLTKLCAAFPVPYILPRALTKDYWPRRIEAVARLSEVCYENPGLSYEVRDTLKAACMNWLAAADLLTIQVRTPERYRVESIRGVLLFAEDYIRDAHKLLDDGS